MSTRQVLLQVWQRGSYQRLISCENGQHAPTDDFIVLFVQFSNNSVSGCHWNTFNWNVSLQVNGVHHAPKGRLSARRLDCSANHLGLSVGHRTGHVCLSGNTIYANYVSITTTFQLIKIFKKFKNAQSCQPSTQIT